MQERAREFWKRVRGHIPKLLGTTPLSMWKNAFFALLGFGIKLGLGIQNKKPGDSMMAIIISSFFSWPTALSASTTAAFWMFILYRAVNKTAEEDATTYREAIQVKDQIIAGKDIEIAKYKQQLVAKKEVQLKIVIEEVFIIPRFWAADCFVKASIHNLTDDRPITIPEYKVCLTIAGKKYCHNRTESDLSGFLRADFAEQEDSDGNPLDGLVAIKTKPLDSLRATISDAYPLKPGFIKKGWLRFDVPGLPPWPVRTHVLGIETRFDDYGEPYPEEETWDEPVPTSVESVELSVRDPFDNWHSVSKAAPLHPWQKGIVRADVKSGK